jgi:predicted short-subunit dehydrogenase-like oxidoreductase (DUF2520 family)
MPVSTRKTVTKSARRPAGVRGSVTVIGLGNWGFALAHALASAKPAAGLVLREVVVRSKPRGRSPLPIKTWDESALDAEFLWLCVPDDAIAATCAELVRRRAGVGEHGLSGQIVLHASGARESALLAAAQQAGARIASVHPVMSFPRRESVPLTGVLYGVETADGACRRRLFQMLRSLDGEPFAIAPGAKHLYHAAGTLASPLLVSAFTAAAETARLAGLAPAAAAKMTAVLGTATLGNIQKHGAAGSFSGPFARGDAGTIKLHLEALAAHPVLAGVYRALALQALDALPVRERESIAALLRAPQKKLKRRRVNAGAQSL